jgi:hypothetical protein
LTEKHADAAQHLTNAKKATKSQILALCNEGLAWRAFGDLEKAEKCHQEALDLATGAHDKGGEGKYDWCIA